MGRVYNVPLKQSQTPATDKTAATAESKTESAKSEDVFLSEKALQEKQEQERQEHPPFYTWTDGQGRLRSEPLPFVDPQTRIDDTGLDVTDYTLLASLRMPQRDQITCCAQFQGRFKERLIELKSSVFSRPQHTELMPTKEGLKPAWYANAPRYKLDHLSEHYPVLNIKVRGTDRPLSMIALDSQYRPLHYLSAMRSQLQPETWRSVAYHESLISIADESVYAFIFYFSEPVATSTTLEVKWLP